MASEGFSWKKCMKNAKLKNMKLLHHAKEIGETQLMDRCERKLKRLKDALP